MEPLISVIITVYNLENYIEQCISSVIGQTYSNLQIIVIDDGSTDRSPEICDQLAKRDSRIEVIHQQNIGAAGAKNRGLRQVRGEYIGFVDGDDFISPDMYAQLLEGCTASKAQISMCGRCLTDENGQRLRTMFVAEHVSVYSGTAMIGKLLEWKGCDSATWDKLFEYQLWKDMRFPNVACDDLMLTINVLEKAEKVAHIPGVMYFYRQRSGSVTRKVFSDSKFDLYYEAEKIRGMICMNHPEFVNKANVFVWHYLCSLISQAYQYRPIHQNQYVKLVKIFMEYRPKLIFSKKEIKNSIKAIAKLVLLIKTDK